MEITKELNIPINRKEYHLRAGQTTTIVLPSPFKISDSIIKIDSDTTSSKVPGEYRIKFSDNALSIHHLKETFTITRPTYIAFEERKKAEELFLNDVEFYQLEITPSMDTTIIVLFENKLSQTRINYFRTLFLRHTIL
ncbi:MAG: hypothetical protein HY062_04020 [Bacteroidetes bacterium]|nr:hypothetical protein [Bacteroidota bacterium]